MSEVVELIPKEKVWDLLVSGKLDIPEYQRGYCWGKKQVEGLLESIWYYDSWEKKGAKLHLGTIVVHESESGKWEIVDGQQRLITLSVLRAKISPNESSQLSLLQCNTDDEDVLKHVHWAALTIENWKDNHERDSIDKNKDKITVDVIKIKGDANLSLAYTFFNAINSAGKKLSDYDLLKSHHLRFLDERDPQEWVANEWDACIQEKIMSFNEEEASLVEELLDASLYRLRRWIRNRGIRNDRGHVFEHYSAYQSITGKCLMLSDSTYASGVVGGMWFFSFVRKYADVFRRFVSSDAVKKLYAFDNAPRHIRLLHVVRALLFLYYCKFCIDGELYLVDAMMFIIQRIGRVRNSYKITESLFSAPIVLHTVEALDESPTPEHFFRYCVLPTNLYVRDYGSARDGTHYNATSSSGIRPAFWQGVYNLYKGVKNNMVSGWFNEEVTFVGDFHEKEQEVPHGQ